MNWCVTWHSSVNLDKCKHVTIGHGSNRQYSLSTDVDIYIIQQCTEESDLGATFTTDLKISHHINNSIRKASKLVGIIYRTFHVLTPHTLHLLYTSLLRLHLDYARVVWQPHLLKDIRALEAVQRRVTRLSPNLAHLTYSVRLKYLNLPSLYYRRLRMDMIMMYKILHRLELMSFLNTPPTVQDQMG